MIRNRQKIVKRALLLVAVSALFFVVILSPTAAMAESLYQQRNTLKQQVTDSTSKSATQKQQAAQLEKDVTKLENQIDYLTGKITEVSGQISGKEEEIKKTEAEIKVEEDNIAKTKTQLGDILSEWYMKGTPSFSEAIISSGNLSQFIDRSEYYEAIKNQIASRIVKIKELKASLEETKNIQENQLTELNSLYKTQSTQKKSLAYSKESKAEMAEVSKDLASKYAATAQAASEKLTQVEGEIKNAEAAAAARYNSGNRTVWTRDGRSTQGFIWPLIGEFRAGFGYSSAYFSGMFHSGIDVGAYPLAPIKAAKVGTVVDTRDGMGNTFSWSRSYGNYVKIEHEGGIYTLYGHLESGTIAVSVGQTVGQGQVIGQEGNSGFSTGYHLHFEMRDPDNIAFDPAPYLP